MQGSKILIFRNIVGKRRKQFILAQDPFMGKILHYQILILPFKHAQISFGLPDKLIEQTLNEVHWDYKNHLDNMSIILTQHHVLSTILGDIVAPTRITFIRQKHLIPSCCRLWADNSLQLNPFPENCPWLMEVMFFLQGIQQLMTDCFWYSKACLQVGYPCGAVHLPNIPEGSV